MRLCWQWNVTTYTRGYDLQISPSEWKAEYFAQSVLHRGSLPRSSAVKGRGMLKVLGRPHTPGERVRLATWPAGMFQFLQCRAQCCLQHLTGDTSVRGMMFLCLCSPSFFFLLMVSCVQNTAIDIYHLQSDNPPPPLTWHTAITFPLSICSLSLRRAQTAPQLTSWNSRSYLWLLSLSIISVSHSQNAPLSTSKHLGS